MTSNTAAPTELGTEKIGKLLRMYAVPGIIAQPRWASAQLPASLTLPYLSTPVRAS